MLSDVLKHHRCRATAPRQAVYDLISSSPRGVTVGEAIGRLRPAGVGQATVYRAIELFEKIGVINCVHGPDGQHRFIAWRPGHMHALVCRACGDAVEFETCGLQVLEKLLASETGYQIEGHHIEIYGTCPQCRNRTPAPPPTETQGQALAGPRPGSRGRSPSRRRSPPNGKGKRRRAGVRQNARGGGR